MLVVAVVSYFFSAPLKNIQLAHSSTIRFYVFTAQCTLVHMRGLGIACRPSVCPSVRPSVTLVDCDHIGWKSWKLITHATSPTPSLFVAKRRSA